MATSIEIKSIDRMKDPKKFEKEFILFPWKIYRSKENAEKPWAKAWCPPLILDHLDRFNRDKNVKLRRIEYEAFVAYRNGEAVGRITAQINKGHLETFHDDCGFFGYFECVEDKDVAHALLNHAMEWCKARGVKKIRGPFNFSINDDWGFKCDCGPDFPGNFETMPMIYQPHNPPYYNDFVLSWGMHKVQDHYAYHLDMSKGLSEKMVRVADYIEKKAEKSVGGITYRHAELPKWEREVELVKEIHANAWEANWGTVPITQDELDQDGKDLKMIIDPRFVWFVFVKGEVAGFIMGIPDINEVQSKINGRLFPFGLLKLLWQVKVRRRWKRGRCILLGMKKKFQGKGLEAPLIVRLFKVGRSIGVDHVELSWIVESNLKMRKEIEPFTDGVWMSYRAYEKMI
ncbi:MAG: GNAT family N-acetyltransferase [Spirochaetia bacterium]|nr:GNAT family N-acetyltransferase [Spirochaetia bacterium]